MMSPPSPPALELQGYGFSFGNRVIVADASFSLPAQGISALMGPVGTGKSSLLFGLAGLNDSNPRFRQWGEKRLNGQVLEDGNRPFLIRQHARLLADTLMNHLLKAPHTMAVATPTGLSSNAERRDRMEQWLASFDQPQLLDKVHQRLIEVEPAWQRIALMVLGAQASSPLLLLDEPSSGLTDTDARILLDFVQKLGMRQKLLLVEHNQSRIRAVADDVLLLAGGRIQGHLPASAFFSTTETDNAIVYQFVQTGGVRLPTPDAKPEDLAEGITPPPPLSPAALAAISEFSSLPPATPTTSVTPILPSAPPPPVSPLSPPVPPPVKVAPAYLQTSRHGVRMVAEIGEYGNAFDARAPRGFVWVIPGQLAGCPQPGITNPIEYDLKLLARVGITTLITLTEDDLEQAPLEEAGLRNLHLPVYDRGVPSMRQIYMLLHRMLRLVEQGEVLAIHCLAGLGRTGTVLAAWMMKEGGLNAAEAIRRLRRLQPGFIQSAEQEEFLLHFEKDLLNRTL